MTPYIHERTELYCTSLPCLRLFSPASVKWHMLEPFIAQDRAVTMSPEAQQVASGQAKPYDVGHNG
jgi:hypothetical protein